MPRTSELDPGEDIQETRDALLRQQQVLVQFLPLLLLTLFLGILLCLGCSAKEQEDD